MCNLGVFNYDDHCTVVIVIHGRLFFIVESMSSTRFGKDCFLCVQAIPVVAKGTDGTDGTDGMDGTD